MKYLLLSIIFLLGTAHAVTLDDVDKEDLAYEQIKLLNAAYISISAKCTAMSLHADLQQICLTDGRQKIKDQVSARFSLLVAKLLKKGQDNQIAVRAEELCVAELRKKLDDVGQTYSSEDSCATLKAMLAAYYASLPPEPTPAP